MHKYVFCKIWLFNALKLTHKSTSKKKKKNSWATFCQCMQYMHIIYSVLIVFYLICFNAYYLFLPHASKVWASVSCTNCDVTIATKNVTLFQQIVVIRKKIFRMSQKLTKSFVATHQPDWTGKFKANVFFFF